MRGGGIQNTSRHKEKQRSGFSSDGVSEKARRVDLFGTAEFGVATNVGRRQTLFDQAQNHILRKTRQCDDVSHSFVSNVEEWGVTEWGGPFESTCKGPPRGKVGQTSCQDLCMVCNEIATRAASPDLLRPLPASVKTSLLVSHPHAREDSFPTTTPA